MENIVKTCKEADCKKEFEITPEEQNYFTNKIDKYTGKPISLPARCKECRSKRRMVNITQATNIGIFKDDPEMRKSIRNAGDRHILD